MLIAGVGFLSIMFVLYLGGTWWGLNKVNESKTAKAGWAYLLLLIVFVWFMIFATKVGIHLIMR